MSHWDTYKTQPCPICEKSGWCGYSGGTIDSPDVIRCMRPEGAEGGTPCKSGGGWLHFDDNRDNNRVPVALPNTTMNAPPKINDGNDEAVHVDAEWTSVASCFEFNGRLNRLK